MQRSSGLATWYFAASLLFTSSPSSRPFQKWDTQWIPRKKFPWVYQKNQKKKHEHWHFGFWSISQSFGQVDSWRCLFLKSCVQSPSESNGVQCMMNDRDFVQWPTQDTLCAIYLLRTLPFLPACDAGNSSSTGHCNHCDTADQAEIWPFDVISCHLLSKVRLLPYRHICFFIFGDAHLDMMIVTCFAHGRSTATASWVSWGSWRSPWGRQKKPRALRMPGKFSFEL